MTLPPNSEALYRWAPRLLDPLLLRAVLAAGTLLAALVPAHAAGLLTPVNARDAAPLIREHAVRVDLRDGFARTEVRQVFHNPNPAPIEVVYACPVPADGSLAEVGVEVDGRTLEGEVLPRPEAQQVYDEEKAAGRHAGLATQEGYETYRFHVANVPADADVVARVVYFQPVALDAGVGRYVYPLAEGGNETAARSFWTRQEQVNGTFRFELDLDTAWPVDDVRLAGFEQQATVTPAGDGRYAVRLELQDPKLASDLVFYYRLREGLPGRVELIPYRAAEGGPGTFMLVLTPGNDLRPITGGADYCFVLDVSGSMEPHVGLLVEGVRRSLAQLDPKDRFRVVAFNQEAFELTQGWRPASVEEVDAAAQAVAALAPTSGTNLHAGLELGLRDLDPSRATNVLLVTDGVTNTGVVEPRAFQALLETTDVRLFAFVVGGEANWPLMRILGAASGGHVAGVSDADDVLGQVTLATQRVAYEALHDVDLSISGVRVFDTSEAAVGKVFRGQQVVFFGRYERGGEAAVTLRARLTGEDRTYRTTVRFPDVAEDVPELERLWALHRIGQVERARDLGRMDAEEAKGIVRGLGVDYQLVTTETAMLLLDDEAFAERGIERRNRGRAEREASARAARAAAPAPSRVADAAQPMFGGPAASTGNGGGAIGPLGALAALGLGAAAWRRARGRTGDRRRRMPE